MTAVVSHIHGIVEAVGVKVKALQTSVSTGDYAIRIRCIFPLVHQVDPY